MLNALNMLALATHRPAVTTTTAVQPVVHQPHLDSQLFIVNAQKQWNPADMQFQRLFFDLFHLASQMVKYYKDNFC